MADDLFEVPRLAAIYDALDGPRHDLDAYLGLVERQGARRVLDVGCGTGTFAHLLAGRGVRVVAVDPAEASLAVARAKALAPASVVGAVPSRITWVQGVAADAADLVERSGRPVDLVTLTGNVAQAIIDPDAWSATLAAAHRVLRSGGHLVFETRDPGARAWDSWTEARTRQVTDIFGVGPVEQWVEVTRVDLPLVSFRWTFRFATDSAELHSESTLRFRPRSEVEADLAGHDFALVGITGAPDRPGLELVVQARRP